MEGTDPKPTIEAPPESQQPEPKKPKMSSATSDDDDETITTAVAADPTKKPRYKRRKIAIFFAYCGVGYQGMQKNPGAKTIEGDLEEALYQSGAVPEHDRGIPKRYDWARSARTDKGVSAVGQVVSGRFYVDPPGFVERLNSNLPAQIRIFGYKRVAASFNAKKFCDRRRYVYLIPVFALDPCSHRDRDSVLASLGSGNELVKCLECSERGRKVVGVVGKREYGDKSPLHILSNVEEASVKAKIKEDDDDVVMDDCESDKLIVEAKDIANESKHGVEVTSHRDILSNEEDAGGKSEVNEGGDLALETETIENEDTRIEPDVNADNGEKIKSRILNEEGRVMNGGGGGFCYGEKERERFNRVLNYYVGSHNFHNFTTRTKAEDPSARRYIISFEAKTTITVEGIEFVKCEVVGQSFMLHQIRKMIGLAVAIMRDCAPESLIETALQKDININVPTAPEVGLYLDECLFASYNQKWKDSHEELSMKDYEEEAEEFKLKHIYSHVASTEHKEGVVGLWLHSLNHRNYPDLQVSGNDGKSAEGANMA